MSVSFVGDGRRVFDSKYLIYPNGNIVNSKTGKFLKHQDNGNGYKKVTLTINGKPIQKYVHRLVAEYFVEKPKIRERLQVNHKDGDKSHNHFWNLEWVTNSQNQIHAHKNGLKPNGNKLWNGKFSNDDILYIKKLKRLGIKQYIIAKEMNVSKSTISDILNGKRYKYIS